MNDPDQWIRTLAGTATERASQPRRICELCVEALGLSGGGISTVTGTGNRGVVCATDAVSAQIEDLQFSLGEGPCVDAVNSGAPVLIGDLWGPHDLAVDRWPGFMDNAVVARIRAVFAFPLRIGSISLGAMDLYRDRPADLTSDELLAALTAADAAAIALLHLDTVNDGNFDGDVDSGTATNHMQVHQATGMVMVQLGISMEEAFLMLRARAFSNGRSLAEVGTDVVERRLRFTSEGQ